MNYNQISNGAFSKSHFMLSLFFKNSDKLSRVSNSTEIQIRSKHAINNILINITFQNWKFWHVTEPVVASVRPSAHAQARMAPVTPVAAPTELVLLPPSPPPLPFMGIQTNLVIKINIFIPNFYTYLKSFYHTNTLMSHDAIV